ncbi:MAG: DNA-processing protein DprA [Candidatus Phlomobacter fragariae]
MQLDLSSLDSFERAISLFEEMAAYESLWSKQGAKFKTIADKFRKYPGTVLSKMVPENVKKEFKLILKNILDQFDVKNFGVRIHGANEYPEKLRDAKHPIEVFYYQGLWNLVNILSIAVVGSRKVSEEGEKNKKAC